MRHSIQGCGYKRQEGPRQRAKAAAKSWFVFTHKREEQSAERIGLAHVCYYF